MNTSNILLKKEKLLKNFVEKHLNGFRSGNYPSKNDHLDFLD